MSAEADLRSQVTALGMEWKRIARLDSPAHRTLREAADDLLETVTRSSVPVIHNRVGVECSSCGNTICAWQVEKLRAENAHLRRSYDGIKRRLDASEDARDRLEHELEQVKARGEEMNSSRAEAGLRPIDCTCPVPLVAAAFDCPVHTPRLLPGGTPDQHYANCEGGDCECLYTAWLEAEPEIPERIRRDAIERYVKRHS